MQLLPDQVFQLTDSVLGDGADEQREYAFGKFLLQGLAQFVIEQV